MHNSISGDTSINYQPLSDSVAAYESELRNTDLGLPEAVNPEELLRVFQQQADAQAARPSAQEASSRSFRPNASRRNRAVQAVQNAAVSFLHEARKVRVLKRIADRLTRRIVMG